MNTLVLGLVPHLISAATVPGGLLERAMTEPLAEGRDEVIYLICTHQRVALGRQVTDDGWRSVFRADGGIGGPFWYDTDTPWAEVRFPPEVRPSALGWAVIDPLLETIEGLPADGGFNPSRDPEGDDGRHRQELLTWIYDRHWELGQELAVDRGEVRDGQIRFRLEYIGKAGQEALRRAAGPHHKVPLVLARTLAYDPHRLVYPLPCDIRAAVYDDSVAESVPLPSLSEAVTQTGLARDILIGAAEEALIASLGAPYNRRNTGDRTFPKSDAGDRLAAAGVERLALAFTGIPERMSICGERATVARDTRAVQFAIPRP